MARGFLAVLNMSLTASFVIAVVLLARLFLRRAPKVISYALWAVVLFNLLCPFKPESVFSLIPFQAEPISEQRVIAPGQEINFFDSDLYPMQTPGDDVYIPANPSAADPDLLPDSSSEKVITHMSGYQAYLIFGSYIWRIGAVVLFMYAVYGYIRLKRRVFLAVRVQDNIYETDKIDSPFVLGLFRPRIFIPTGMEVALTKHIIEHERTHIKRRDYLVSIIAFVALALHWFNPLVWVAYMLMLRDMESSCDEAVLRNSNGDIRCEYSSALLNFTNNKRQLSFPLAFGEQGVKERVKNVLSFKKASRVLIVVAIALVTVLSVGFAVNRANNTTNTANLETNITPAEWFSRFDSKEADASLDSLIEPERLDDNIDGGYVPSVVNEELSLGILDKIYLGMTNEEVYELFGEPNFRASGMMWYGYNDIGTFDPSLGFNGSIERISLDNGWSWSMHDLISTAVKQQSNGQYYTPDGAYPTESHTILSLDANKDGFTVYIISQWLTFLPDGEYNVRDVGGTHSSLALTFTKNRNGDYELMEYWQPNDGTYYMPSIRSKFPQSTWDSVDTQLYTVDHYKSCYDQAMYFFVGALPGSARFGLHKGGTAAITDYAECSTVDDDVFLIKYFPGATLAIEEYDEQYAIYPSNYTWVIEYADSSKNITVDKDGMGAIPITDDMFGIYNSIEGKYEIKFERYVTG